MRITRQHIVRALLCGLWLSSCGSDDADNQTGADTSPTNLPDATAADTQASVDLLPDAQGDIRIAVSLDRRAADGPDPIIVNVLVTNAGIPTPGEQVLVKFADSAQTATDLGAGNYSAEYTPTNALGEVPIQVSTSGHTVERVALVLPTVAEGWGQPEAVPGLVNTPAYEDSPEISPDGRWLLVSNYSPVDLICCFIGCDGSGVGNPASAPCNTVLGPITAPERPNMPGAARVASPTEVIDKIPSLGLVGENDTEFAAALSPVAGYGFALQDDGSFAAPFVIAFDGDGFTGAPFGFTFVGAPSESGSAVIVYAWDDPRLDGHQDADLFSTTIQLGQNNNLGTLSIESGEIRATPQPALLPFPDHATTQSNAYVAPEGVYFDQHGEEGIELDVLIAPSQDGGAALGAPIRVGISQDARSEYQPFLHAGRLYYVTGEFVSITSAAQLDSAQPSLPESWGAEQVELSVGSPTPEVGAIISLGEPSLANQDGTTWLYFLYGIKTDTGTNANVGRVRAKR
jgi:hypothetical protein